LAATATTRFLAVLHRLAVVAVVFSTALHKMVVQVVVVQTTSLVELAQQAATTAELEVNLFLAVILMAAAAVAQEQQHQADHLVEQVMAEQV
jgi:TRAP-type C4-dicarboxylate transport system permease small subunit